MSFKSTDALWFKLSVRRHSLTAPRMEAVVKGLLRSVNHAAHDLDVGRTKIYELIAQGELTLVKIGKKSLITADSIEALVLRLRERAVNGR